MNARHRTLALAVGFALGQGSVFLVNACLLWRGQKEAAGLLVALTACFSFTLLFADIANPTRLVQLIARGDAAGISDFLAGRSLVGGLAGGALALLLMAQITGGGLAVLCAVCAGLAAAVYGRATAAHLEALGAYWRFSLVQCVPWVAFALVSGIAFAALDTEAAVAVIALSMPLVAMGYALLAGRQAQPRNPARSPLRVTWWGKAGGALPYLVGPLLSQVWGRLVILMLVVLYGAPFLGEFGLFRQMEVAAILMFGFALRPVIARLSGDAGDSGDRHGAREGPDHGVPPGPRDAGEPRPRAPARGLAVDARVLPVLRLAFAFSAAVLLGFFGLRLAGAQRPLGAWVDWMPLLSGVFLATVGLCFSQAAQLVNDGPALLRLELAGQLTNMCIFFALVTVTPLGAILLAEGAQATMYRLRWLKAVRHAH